MNRSSPINCLWLLAVSFFVPALLQGADVTNQPAHSSPMERPSSAGTNLQVQVLAPTVAVGTRIVYKPPLRGAPAVRIDGGSRGSGISLICLNVLAPDHTGLTVHDQPSLFWYQSEPADVPFELTLCNF